ncbi:MAG: hypothetical protein D6784_16235 [Chloroflexi bacterium]|nr:MAG: hypothetical protein D6784_16235 [Chloroflexota bacterium]
MATRKIHSFSKYILPVLVVLFWLVPAVQVQTQDPPPATPPAPPTPIAPADGPSVLPDSAPPADVLPAPGIGAEPEPSPTVVPPVSLRTVLTPPRLVWLFIIGLVVFTISYGVQVAIWYRLKR